MTANGIDATRQEIAWVLTEEFKEGDTFTKHAVRERCSRGQLDMQWPRRFRKLRDYGYVIDTSQQDPSLRHNQHRLVKRAGASGTPAGSVIPCWTTRSTARTAISRGTRARRTRRSPRGSCTGPGARDVPLWQRLVAPHVAH